MTNMIDYIRWRGDIPFSFSPFNEIDNIIFAMLSFVDLSGIVPPDALSSPVTLSECLNAVRARYPEGQYFGTIIPNDTNMLLLEAGSSVRFGDTYVSSYRNEIDESNVKQFAAVTFILPDNTLYVSFRGTDDTLVGWREDFEMSYNAPTMSQKCAAQYLADIAASHSGKIRVGGHSKGGNLSVYSAAFAPTDVQERIMIVYNNDGPGFVPELLDTDGFRAIDGKIYSLVPQSSVVGILLSGASELNVIESTESNGAKQHNPYSWVAQGTSFKHLPELSRAGKRHNNLVDSWIMDSTPAERKKLTETVFSVLEASGAKTLSDITDDKLGSTSAIIKAIAGLDKQTREEVTAFFKRLAGALRPDK